MTMFPNAGVGLCGVCGGYSCSGDQHRSLPRELRARLAAAYDKQARLEVEDLWLEVRAFEVRAFERTQPATSTSLLPRGGGRTLNPAVLAWLTRSPHVVRLSAALHASLRESGAQWDGREVGGWLFGAREGGGIRLSDLSTPRAYDKRSQNWVELDVDHAEAIAGQLHPSQRTVGEYHSHQRSALPSPEDVELYARRLERWGLDRYVGVILTPDRYRVRSASAFIARRTDSRIVVEPADIEED